MDGPARSGAAGTGDILAWLTETVRTYAKDKVMPLSGDTRLGEIGMDSFSVIELTFRVEDAYGIEFDFNANHSELEETTLGEIARRIANARQEMPPL